MNKKAMYKLSYGLFVLTAKQGDKDNGCIINTAIQAASDPNTISIAVNKSGLTHDIVLETGLFNISIISQEADFGLFKHFGFQSGRDVNKFEDFGDFARTANGLPYITAGTNAYISCQVKQSVDMGSHTVFFAQILDMDVLGDAPSVTYEYYQENIKPRPEAVARTADGKTVWRCRICGYEYVGEELPEGYICPICKHPAEDFEKVQG